MAITQIVIASPVGETLFNDTAMGSTLDAIKASSTLALWVMIDNTLNPTGPVYVKLFNALSGNVTLGTSIPDEVIYVPAGAKVTRMLFTGANPGVTFATGLTAACVTAGGTAGVTAPTNAVPVTVAYV